MRKKHTPLVAGNWKMNPKTVGEAKKIFLAIRDGIKKQKHQLDIVIAPPFPYLSELERLSPSKRIELAAQDIFYESQGAFTGEVSLPMLKSVGVTYAIIGHSERRAMGESNDEIAKDIAAAVKYGVTPIICVGEKKRDSSGNYFTTVENQLNSALSNIPKNKMSKVLIAYEPIWAIGTGNHATGEDIEEMRLFIQKVLTDLCGRTTAGKIRILYGGSVKKVNAEEILMMSNVDGFLIGGASLRPKEFIEIVKITASHAAH